MYTKYARMFRELQHATKTVLAQSKSLSNACQLYASIYVVHAWLPYIISGATNAHISFLLERALDATGLSDYTTPTWLQCGSLLWWKLHMLRTASQEVTDDQRAPLHNRAWTSGTSARTLCLRPRDVPTKQGSRVSPGGSFRRRLVACLPSDRRRMISYRAEYGMLNVLPWTRVTGGVLGAQVSGRSARCVCCMYTDCLYCTSVLTQGAATARYHIDMQSEGPDGEGEWWW